MTGWIVAHGDAIRLAVFLGMLAAMLAWELASPLRRAEVPRLFRWANNLALVVVDGIAVRLVFPLAAVGAALWAEARGTGLLRALDLHPALAIAAAILLLDLAIWAQHRVFHAVPLLWRLHRVHHADLDVDASTGLRFHPFEILLSMAIKIAVVVALGAPAVAVLLFEVILNATSIFNHANIRLSPAADRVLRLFVVTPDMHRVHHSWLPEETNSNFGFNLPWWDRLFGTYRPAPRDGQTGMTVGLRRFRAPVESRLDRMLVQPFRADGAP